MSKTSWIVVVDRYESAIGIAAQNRFQNTLSTVISSDDFYSINGLLENLIEADAPQVLFAWRGALRGVWSSEKSLELFEKLRSSKRIFASVVDHAGIDSITTEKSIINLVDGYFVSSKELFDLYKRIFPTRPPIGILRDLPNYQAIVEIRKTHKPAGVRVIWVGNSTWGNHAGYRDHKGYSEIINPLFKYLGDEFDFECIVVDSARNRISNLETLKLIHQSHVLVQASRNEGTGMPILEALGLNTAILTTNVGVAPELNLPSQNIFSRTDKIEEIANKIRNLVNENRKTENLFDEYISHAFQIIDISNTSTMVGNKVPNVDKPLDRLVWELKWFRRWLMQLLSRDRS